MKRIAIALVTLAAVAAIGIPEVSRAAITLKLYEENKSLPAQQQHLLMGYVDGVGHGIEMANYAISSRGEAPLFCLPPKFELDENLITSLLDQEIASPASGTPYPQEAPVQTLLMISLQVRFPCRAGK